MDCFVAPSAFTVSKMEGLFKSRFEVVPTFINKSEDYNANLGDYALFVGRIEEEKGVMDAIKAAEGA